MKCTMNHYKYIYLVCSERLRSGLAVLYLNTIESVFYKVLIKKCLLCPENKENIYEAVKGKTSHTHIHDCSHKIDMTHRDTHSYPHTVYM